MKTTARGRAARCWTIAARAAILTISLAAIGACVPAPAPGVPAAATSAPATAVGAAAGPGPTDAAPAAPSMLATVVVPTAPAESPGYAKLDTATGLHVTGTAQRIDLASYRLEVSGKVDHPLRLSYDDLRRMPRLEARTTLSCPGVFEDVATWAGASLAYVMGLAGVQEGANNIQLVSADGYSMSVPLANARSGENFLAYEWEGQPLPILHGFPVRAVFPGLEGNTSVKWLVRISVY